MRQIDEKGTENTAIYVEDLKFDIFRKRPGGMKTGKRPSIFEVNVLTLGTQIYTSVDPHMAAWKRENEASRMQEKEQISYDMSLTICPFGVELEFVR